MSDGINSTLGLDDLLENDVSSYELFHSLPKEVQRKVKRRDVRSFAELCSYVNSIKRGDIG
ncbi:MAG: hypothetical protein E7554_10005 [Ruminococcaceae bacterium]|nr:hypothetical protein [Oscillospiraceae bacterium]